MTLNGKQIAAGVGIITILLVTTSLLFQKNCEVTTSTVVSEEGIILVEYEKPRWLEEHTKECEIEKYIFDQYVSTRAGAKELQEEFPDTALLPFRIDIQTSRTIVEPYESVLITGYTYTGGAHGNTGYAFFNTKQSKDITLEEYVSDTGYPVQDLLQDVNQRLANDQYEAIQDLYLPYSEPMSYIPWQVYRRENGLPGITLIFPPYSVAAYAAGTIVYSF